MSECQESVTLHFRWNAVNPGAPSSHSFGPLTGQARLRRSALFSLEFNGICSNPPALAWQEKVVDSGGFTERDAVKRLVSRGYSWLIASVLPRPRLDLFESIGRATSANEAVSSA